MGEPVEPEVVRFGGAQTGWSRRLDRRVRQHGTRGIGHDSPESCGGGLRG